MPDGMYRVSSRADKTSIFLSHTKNCFSPTPTCTYLRFAEPNLSKASIQRMFSKIDHAAPVPLKEARHCGFVGVQRYGVMKRTDGGINIGCQKFSAEETQVLRHWSREEN
jgi:hypothetical protein